MSSDLVSSTLLRKVFVASVFGVGVFLTSHGVLSAASNSATLQWAANQESDFAGYRTYHGTTSGNYGSSQDVGKVTTYQYVNLASNVTHYFAVTAYDTSGNESSPSLEVSKAIPGPNSLLSISISGGGTVNSSPTGVTCSGGTCSGTFPQGSSVTISASPSSGSTFSGWGGACTGTGSCVLTLSTSSVAVSANFAASPPPTSSLSVTLAGGGSGMVTGDVSCSSGTCTDTFPQDTSVTLSASPSSGSTFSGWGGACTGTSSCVVALSTSSVSVSASFATSPPPSSSLHVTMAGTGNGTVTSSPTGVICSSGTCSGTFPQGSSVTLSGSASSGSTFSGWGGACTGTSSCVVALSTSSASVSASFASNPTVSHALNVSMTGDGKGNVTSSPLGLTCSGGTCTGSFTEGTIVTLTPTTEAGSVFQGWNGGCNGTSSCAVMLTSSKSVGAVFSAQNPNPPSPEFPMLINFQPSSSEVPQNFLKDDGKVFDSSRGYGWDALVKGSERNANVDQTIDTFIQTFNKTSNTWNCTLPNGTYYISMVMGDPRKAQGPHWMSIEGMPVATEITTGKGQYLTLVEYPVDVTDNTLSIALGGGDKGSSLMNFLIINSNPSVSPSIQTLNAPSLSPIMQVLAHSLGTDLIAKVVNSGTMTKVNPEQLVKQDNARQKKLARIAKKRQRLLPRLTKFVKDCWPG